MNLVSLCNIRNGKSVSKNLIRNEHWQLVPSPFVYKELCMTSIENEVFLNKRLMLKLGKYVKISIQTSSDPFFRGLFENKNGAGNFQAAFLEYFFD